jgi:hypothetical protein
MTAPLSKAPSAPRAAPPGAGTGPMAGTATGALPKATVKLQQTQPMAKSPMAAPPSAPVKRAAAADSQQFYEDEKDPEAGLVGMSVLCLVASVVLLAVQMLGSDKVMSAPAGQASALMVPAVEKVDWEIYNAATQQWTNRFKDSLPTIPE